MLGDWEVGRWGGCGFMRGCEAGCGLGGIHLACGRWVCVRDLYSEAALQRIWL